MEKRDRIISTIAQVFLLSLILLCVSQMQLSATSCDTPQTCIDVLNLECIFRSLNIEYETAHVSFSKPKDWTFIVYMSAVNDLDPFARKNLVQLTRMGSNQHINIVVHLDIVVKGNQKVTLRYYVEKNKLILTNFDQPSINGMDSGDPKTLIDACKWAIENFPARHYALDLWDHGSGIIDIGRPRLFNPSELFTFNPSSNMLELSHDKPFLDFITLPLDEDQKGICFDDYTGHYISNQDLDFALKTICTTHLKGKKFSVIIFDACLMAMIEVADIVKQYTEYVTFSEEVEYGTGYHYEKVLAPFNNRTLTPRAFAQHIVEAYHDTYSPITNDFTHSAVELALLPKLEQAVHEVAGYLIEALKFQKNATAKKTIQNCRHKLYSIEFDEPSYIDAYVFFNNLLAQVNNIQSTDPNKERTIKNGLRQSLETTLHEITNCVIANTVGANVANARGLAIYFPQHKIHNSYRKTEFAKNNSWGAFLNYYLAS